MHHLHAGLPDRLPCVVGPLLAVTELTLVRLAPLLFCWCCSSTAPSADVPWADLCLSRFARSCLASATAAALCGLLLLAAFRDDMRFLAGEVLASPALWVRGWGGEGRSPSG